MYKISIFVSMILFLGVSFCLAQTEEKLTITTYYPSPYGVYNELQANRIAVGDTNDDGQLTALDLPNRDGDIRLKPQPGDPATWPDGKKGQFAYSQVDDALYHYNGSKWMKQAGISGYTIIIGGSVVANSWCGATWGTAKCGHTGGVIDWNKTGCNEGTMVWGSGDYANGRQFFCIKSF